MNTKIAPATEEARIQYKILGLKLQAHRQISQLGERVYSLLDFMDANPGSDSRVKDITAKLRRYETEIRFMENHLRSMQK